MPLTLRGISKRFGNTVALDDVTMLAAPGEVHALLGENGAGKSTLMRIAYGLMRPDAGTIDVDGVTSGRGFRSPRVALAAGIGMVHQHFTSIPALTVAENIALTAGWSVTSRAATLRAAALIDALHLPLPVTAAAATLSVQLLQRLEIVKALAAHARILLLDEPTASLAPRETTELLAFLRRFADGGNVAVLITHKLDDVLRTADRVTVLRRGRVTLSTGLEGQTATSLAHAMMGAAVPVAVHKRAPPGALVVRTQGLVLESAEAEGPGVRRAGPVSFALHAGEVVGVAAIEGNGQRELLRGVAGVTGVRAITGTLERRGDAGFIPENRTTEGIIPTFTLTENLLLGRWRRTSRWLRWGVLQRCTEALMAAHDVRPQGAAALASSLSGGNQQKLIFARVVDGRPAIIVAEDPTRGLDLVATAAIHARLRESARDGAAVLVHSSDLDEVLELADRLFIVCRGTVRELPPPFTREAAGDAMLGIGG